MLCYVILHNMMIEEILLLYDDVQIDGHVQIWRGM